MIITKPNVIASPMYLFDEAATREWLNGLAQHLDHCGLHATVNIKIENVHTHWVQPDILVTQACGYPLMHELEGKVQLLGTFGYTAEGCSAWYARSAIVLRRSPQLDTLATLQALQGLRFAYNSVLSQSGFHAFAKHLQRKAQEGSSPVLDEGDFTQFPNTPNQSAELFFSNFFRACLETGSHQASVQALHKGDADVAALDCVSWAGLQKNHPEITENLRVLAWTYAYPNLPLITSLSTTQAQCQTLQKALHAALNDPSLRFAKESLFLETFYPTQLTDYHSI
jgi:ABC-type phosphate/phosphonate transport system substrate-binding protein